MHDLTINGKPKLSFSVSFFSLLQSIMLCVLRIGNKNNKFISDVHISPSIRTTQTKIIVHRKKSKDMKKSLKQYNKKVKEIINESRVRSWDILS